MVTEMRLSEDKAQREMIDAARLADELRSEQDMAGGLSQECRVLEAQVKDSAVKLDEVEQHVMKSGKKAVAKMETRIRELCSELDAETRRMTDAQKNLRRSERKVVELNCQQDEDRKNRERMQVQQPRQIKS